MMFQRSREDSHEEQSINSARTVYGGGQHMLNRADRSASLSLLVGAGQ